MKMTKIATLSLATLVVFLNLSSSWAAGSTLPHCWKSDQPNVEDGLFVVTIPTAGRSAQDIAEVMFTLTSAMATQKAVGTTSDLSSIEIDMDTDVKDWHASLAFPSVEALKNYILKTLEPAANLPGVVIRCQKEVHLTPHT